MTVDRTNRSIAIDGAPIFSGPLETLLAEISRMRSLDKPCLIVTPNVDQVLTLATNAEFRDSFRNADLRILDGMPLVLLARALGARSTERHTGADLLHEVAKVASIRKWRVAILGGDPATGEEAARTLNQEFGHRFVISVPFPRITTPGDPAGDEAIAALHDARPDVVFICLGSPKQELWFTHRKTALPPAVYVGAGAAADFASGRVTRAPRIVQRLALEWAWRLGSEPRRLAGRYLVRGPRFLKIMYNSWSASRNPTTDR